MDRKHHIKSLERYAGTETFSQFINYFNFLLDDTRKSFDDAEKEEIYKLQGQIRILKQVLKLQERHTSKPQHDGAYS